MGGVLSPQAAPSAHGLLQWLLAFLMQAIASLPRGLEDPSLRDRRSWQDDLGRQKADLNIVAKISRDAFDRSRPFE